MSPVFFTYIICFSKHQTVKEEEEVVKSKISQAGCAALIIFYVKKCRSVCVN